MATTDTKKTWILAADFDPALRAGPKLMTALEDKRVSPQRATREALFTAIAKSRPAILAGVHVPVKRSERIGLQSALIDALTSAFKNGETANAQIGSTRVRRRLAVSELIRRWETGRHLVGVTDLHIRGTALERKVNTDQLSVFNLLPLGSDEMQTQEMMTMVISSSGNVTDSHSDDPDGSNHCFIGRKLWLAWDTFEGRGAGLQDCSRDLINDRARFELGTFCSLQSAQWWTVEPGETLFLPGRMAHRVITLEPYMGIGSFYCTPASCLENLGRWYLNGPLWSLDDVAGTYGGLVDEIAKTMKRTIQRLKRQKKELQLRWGLDYATFGLQDWRLRCTQVDQRKLMKNPLFADLVHTIEGIAPPSKQ